jgi:recombination protein RecA
VAAKKKATKKKKASKPEAATPSSVVLAVLQKKFTPSVVTTLTREKKAMAQIREYIPTGIDVVDKYVIGRGGFPVGRISETFGAEGSGKTALIYCALGTNQRNGGVSMLLDAEHAFDEERAEVAGINTKSLLLAYPKHLEEALDLVITAARAHNPKFGPFLVALDTLAALKTKSGVSLAIGEAHYRGEAQLLSDELREMPRTLHKHRTHFAIINQTRTKIGGGGYGGPEIITPGGNAPKFYTSLRLQFFGGKAIKDAHDQHIAKVTTLVCVKNRLQRPFTKAKVRFDYATGYNDRWTTVAHAKRMGVIKPRRENGETPSLASQYEDALIELGWAYNDKNDAAAALDGRKQSREVSEDSDD